MNDSSPKYPRLNEVFNEIYYAPQNFECNKCQYSFSFTMSEKRDAPIIENADLDSGSHFAWCPICPRCWEAFLIENIGYGIMQHENNNE